MTQELYRNQCIYGRPHKIFPEEGCNVEILLIRFRLLTMEGKWTFTKRVTLSTH